MAQTLDTALAAAQLLTERKPLVEVLSDKFVPDIPFVGQRLSGEHAGGEDYAVNAIVLSDGRLAIITSTTTLSLSNADRTVLTDYAISSLAGYDSALAEMDDGNLAVLNGDGTYFKLNVTDNTGATYGYGTISGWAKVFHLPVIPAQDTRTDKISMIRLADGSYMAVYVASDGYPPTYGNIYIRMTTSDDFVTWATPTAISMPNLVDTRARYNPFLFQTEDGTVHLLFEYVEALTVEIGTTEKVNIYHFETTNGGASWSVAPGSSAYGAITYYPDYTVTARHPYAISLGEGNWRISYHESMSALHMNTTAVGWEGGDYALGMHFDPVSRRLYVTTGSQDNYHHLSAIVVVDPDTWSPVKSITQVSSPTFNDMWFSGGSLGEGSVTGERELVVLRSGNHIAVYNADTDQVTEFHFDTSEAFGIAVNCGPKPEDSIGGIGHSSGPMTLQKVFLDYANRMLYLYWMDAYIWGGRLGVSKIDLTQAGPYYNNEVMFTKGSYPTAILFSEAEMTCTGGGSGDFRVYPADNLITITGGQETGMEGLGGPWIGMTVLYTMDGDLIYHFNKTNSDTYPYRGMLQVVKVGTDLWGYFNYEPLYGDENKRGIAKISLLDFSVSYFRPSFVFVDDYHFNEVVPILDGEELLLTTDGYGAAIYNIASAEWTQFNNANYPGLFLGSETAQGAQYDEENGFVFLRWASVSYGGIMYFDRDGFMNQPQYLTAVYSGGSWSYGAAASLIYTRDDRDLVMTPDPATSGGMYAFWVHAYPDDSTRIYWEKDLSDFDLTDYLVGGSNVTIKRSIDGSPHKLSFSVTHGHLFDPHNVGSLWSPVLKKFRRITVRFGEEINGVPYWHNAGTFVVCRTKLSYERGQYPNMSVECEDVRIWWEDAEIVTTEHYETSPELILADVLATWGGLDPGDIEIPSMEGSYEVWFQWLDTSLKKVVDGLCNRFGYFPTITVDNKFTCRKISNANAADHTYPDAAMVIAFTPDDDFSDFTNRVTVVGESRDFIDALYEEEAVGTLYGTAGWWGGKQTYDVWYSQDHKQKAKNPRLVIVASVIPNSFIQELGGGSESIVFVDADEFFCRVEVRIPDMSTIAWGLGITTLAAGIACASAGVTYAEAGWGVFFGFIALLSALLYILSGIVTYQYEIWARPFGQQRVGCAGQANDVPLQALIGKVIEKKIDEPLAINPTQCDWIADHELMIVMMQRNRVSFEKIAHLQDEEGDTLVLPHPYSGQDMTVFVTDLTRSYKIPSGNANEKGGFIDSITGWKVAPL
jgi:hypothetical protein